GQPELREGRRLEPAGGQSPPLVGRSFTQGGEATATAQLIRDQRLGQHLADLLRPAHLRLGAQKALAGALLLHPALERLRVRQGVLAHERPGRAVYGGRRGLEARASSQLES